MQEAFHFSYGSGTHEGDGYKTGIQVTHSGQTYTESYFVTQSHVLNSFVAPDVKSIHYNLYDRAERKSVSGRLGNVGNVALRPILQCGKCAYAVILPDEAAVYGVKGIAHDGVVIIRYGWPE